MNLSVHALVPAAGEGQRMGGDLPKQYMDIAGKEVLVHAVEALGLHPAVSGVTVAIASDDHHFETLTFDTPVPVDSATGGVSRAETVLNGLQHIRRVHGADWVLVHDAARPCLPAACLQRLLDYLPGVGVDNGTETIRKAEAGAILAIPVRDTLKREDGHQKIASTIERDGLWAAQTPQLFPLDSLLRAMQLALESGKPPTDEAGAMEQCGLNPALVVGSAANIKITWPEDLLLAQSWLGRHPFGE